MFEWRKLSVLITNNIMNHHVDLLLLPTFRDVSYFLRKQLPLQHGVKMNDF